MGAALQVSAADSGEAVAAVGTYSMPCKLTAPAADLLYIANTAENERQEMESTATEEGYGSGAPAHSCCALAQRWRVGAEGGSPQVLGASKKGEGHPIYSATKQHRSCSALT